MSKKTRELKKLYFLFVYQTFMYLVRNDALTFQILWILAGDSSEYFCLCFSFQRSFVFPSAYAKESILTLIFSLDRCVVIAFSLGGVGGYEELLEIVTIFQALKEIKLLVVAHYYT